MYNIMGKKIAVNAKVVLADGTFISTAHAHASDITAVPLVLRWYRRKGYATGKTSQTPRGILPRNLDPVDQREQVMIGPSEMRR